MKSLGIDISKYDFPINLSLATKQIDFIIQRVSYNLNTDEQFYTNYEAIRNVEIRGAYHYFSTYYSWKEQADKFLFLINSKNFNFFVIDYETAFNTLNAVSANNLRLMLEYIKPIVAPKKVLYYTNPNIYKTYLAPYGDWMKNWELWVAQYPYIQSLNLEKGPALPAGVTNWAFWQYGGGLLNTAGYGMGHSYGLGSASCDLDQFNGTIEELKTWVGITAPISVPVDGKEIRLNELNRLQEYIDSRKEDINNE